MPARRGSATWPTRPSEPAPALPIEQITGLVLAGGRGSRMGGVDKGLQPYRGVPLALHALRRLQPQVGRAMVSANRNLATYASFGVPVWTDARADFSGPLAGMLTGLQHCETPYLATAPCDTPDFPQDLVAQLAQALVQAEAEIAIAVTRGGGAVQAQPVFCLLGTTLRPSLLAWLDRGERRIDRWAAQHRVAEVTFDDAAAFRNANTADELRQLQAVRIEGCTDPFQEMRDGC
jgi:molybdopterin-guanine dinucleotide biosynthesis protein A